MGLQSFLHISEEQKYDRLLIFIQFVQKIEFFH